MFSKNIKILSLFLILAVVMIGALGAVSADTLNDGGTTNITTNPADNNTITQGSAGTATGELSGTVVTSTDSNGTSTVPEGQAVNSTSADPAGTAPTATIANGAYVSTNASETGNTVATVAGATATLNKDGTFTITSVTITSYGALTNGTKYFVPFTLDTNVYAFTNNGDTYALNVTTTQYLSFVYLSNKITLTNDNVSASYGDDWTYSGTVTDTNGKALSIPLSVQIGSNPAVTIYSGSNGAFSFTNINMGNLNAGTYTVTVTDPATGVKTTGNLTINKKNLTITGVINATEIAYGESANITVTLYDSEGNVFNNTIPAITLAQKNTVATGSDIATAQTFVDGVNSTVFTPAKAATYTITVSGVTDDNYNIANNLTYTLVVDTVDTSLTPTTPINANITDANVIVPIAINTTTNKTDLTGKYSYIIYDTNGNVVNTGNQDVTNAATQNLTIAKSQFAGAGNYTVKVTFKPGDDGYKSATTTATVYIKSASTITVNQPSNINIVGAANTTTTNITVSTPAKTNETVNIFIGNSTTAAATVTLVNGTGSYNLSSLSLPAGKYNITYTYPGNDNYNPVSITKTLTVTPETIGTLNTNTTKITINLTSGNVIALNLTNGTNLSQIIDYTGPVAYYVGTTTSFSKATYQGNITMTNGVADVTATSLKGLTTGTNYVFFVVDNDVNSTNAVRVTIIANTLNTAIVANNITTNNATSIDVIGTVTNATEGTVNVTIYDKKGNVVANVYNVPVAADGSFDASLGALANGNYTANVTYLSATGLSAASSTNVSVIVNGTAPTPTPVGNITTVLTLNNFTEVVGAGQNLTGTLTDVNGTPIVGQHIALNLTNPRTGASKIYWVTTDTDGAFQLAINLAIGTYTASASYAGNSYDNVNFTAAGPVDATITVTDNVTPSNKTATILTVEQNFTEVYGAAQNLTGVLTDINGTPILGQHLVLNLTRVATGQSKIYYRTTDSDGAYQIPIELSVGAYTVQVSYDGTSVYESAATNVTSFNVTAA